MAKDDDLKTKAAVNLLKNAKQQNIALCLLPVTILETVWVLEKVYSFSKKAVQEVIEAILNTPELWVEREEKQKIILDASMTIEKNTVPFALKTFKEYLEEAKKKAKLYSPTPAELSLWKEGMTSIWDDLAKGNEEVSTAFKNVQAILNR